MKSNSLSNHKAALAAILVALAGLGLIICARTLPVLAVHSTIQMILKDVGSVMLASVAIGVIWDRIMRRSFLDEVFATANLGEDIRKSGLSRVYSDFDTQVNWDHLFRDTTRFDMFIAYGLFVRHLLRPYLERVAANSQSSVKIVLPDPGNEMLVAELSRRFGRTKEEIIIGITEAAEEFNQILRNSKGSYSLIYTATNPVYTCYRFGSKYLIAFYPNYPQRVKVPTLLVEEGCHLFDFFEKDFERVAGMNTEQGVSPNV